MHQFSQNCRDRVLYIEGFMSFSENSRRMCLTEKLSLSSVHMMYSQKDCGWWLVQVHHKLKKHHMPEIWFSEDFEKGVG